MTTLHEVGQYFDAPSHPPPPERRRAPRRSAPPPVYLELAKWLLTRESSDVDSAVSVPEAAERVCQKLLERLAKLITPSGCHALLARALHLACEDFRFLRGIQPESTAGTYLGGLMRSAEGTDPGQVHRGLAWLLGTLLELVALFIGDYLTRRMLREIWPDVPVLEPAHTLHIVE
ncbi:MAG TPA: hypothetical protein VKV73_28455 [Chloroflexota bacterium]|nr:hypothetical protein [Chloroflexota bacterium]